MDEAPQIATGGLARMGQLRLCVGLIQGLLLYLIQEGMEHKVWLFGDPVAHAALFGAAFFAPLVFIAELGALRRGVLALWTASSGLIAAFLMGYAIWRDAGDPRVISAPDTMYPAGMIVAATLYIGAHLIEASEIDRRLLARYPSYFEPGWKHAVQGGLSVIFTAVFWGLLYLGAALFDAIGVKFVSTTLREPWFYWPATSVAFASAVHLTDVRTGLVRGVRLVVLTLLGWLTPVLTLLAGAFLLTLPFVGLGGLWRTHAAASILLSSASALVLLINAAYQDGEAEVPVVLRWTVRIAAALLLPLVALALVGLALRVGQYGLSPQRIFCFAWAVIAAGYALGYLASAIDPRAWMRWLERVNVIQAWLILLVIALIYSPLADPNRLAVDDQLARLKSGRVTPDAFDYGFLRFKAGRFGRAALHDLATRTGGGVTAEIAEQARRAEAAKNLWLFNQHVVTPADRAALITVYPAGRELPEGFLQQDWSENPIGTPACLSGQFKRRCIALLTDLDGDGADEVLIADAGPDSATSANGTLNNTLYASSFIPAPTFQVFHVMAGVWSNVGWFSDPCHLVQPAAAGGRITLASPLPSPWRDLMIDGQRLTLQPQVQFTPRPCEKAVEPSVPPSGR